jgi:hypothetical protein
MQNCEYKKTVSILFAVGTHVRVMMPQSLLTFFSRLLLKINIKVLAQLVSARIKCSLQFETTRN